MTDPTLFAEAIIAELGIDTIGDLSNFSTQSPLRVGRLFGVNR
jgi:hypothetical protein